MSAVYRALLAEGDHYLEDAQAGLAGDPALAAANATLAQALYARAALEKPEPVNQLLSKLAAMKPPATVEPNGDEVTQSMNRHPAGKKRAPRKAPGGTQ